MNRYDDREYEPEVYQKEPMYDTSSDEVESEEDRDRGRISSCWELHSLLNVETDILYALENNLLSVKGELIRDIGIDRRRDIRDEANNTIELSLSRSPLCISNSRDSEVDNMINEGKRWRLLEVSFFHPSL